MDLNSNDPKTMLHGYLQGQREALLSKLDGLGERDLRRPMTGTGTNLLGLVKHVASVEAGYLGDCMGRPSPFEMPWMGPEAEDNADMFATAEESSEHIVGLYRQAWEHDDETIRSMELDAQGHVPWWAGERNPVTLRRLLLHVIAETARHAGHADIVREEIDGAAGFRPGASNMPEGDAQWWVDYVGRLQGIADAAPDGEVLRVVAPREP